MRLRRNRDVDRRVCRRGARRGNDGDVVDYGVVDGGVGDGRVGDHRVDAHTHVDHGRSAGHHGGGGPGMTPAPATGRVRLMPMPGATNDTFGAPQKPLTNTTLLPRWS